MRDEFRNKYLGRFPDRPGILVPTIEWNGQFGELEVESLTKPHIRKQTRRGPARLKGQETELYVDTDQFEPREHGYELEDGRRVFVTVFVHDAFMRGIESKQRHEAIRLLVRKRAAWIFSYAHKRG